MSVFNWLQCLTPFDRKLLVVAALVVAVSFSLPLTQSTGARVVVRSADKVIFVAPLNQSQRVELNGPLGITVLEIANGEAKVVSSPCSHKVCLRMGPARHTGDLIACVPNRLVIRIEGKITENAAGYDFISR